MTWIIPVFLFSLFITSALAEDCSCDHYASHLEITRLGLQVSRIGVIDAFHPEGASLSSAQEARRLSRELESLVPAECRTQQKNRLTPRERFQLEARFFQISQPQSTALNTWTPAVLLNAYEKAFSAKASVCSLAPQSQECFRTVTQFSNSLQNQIETSLQMFHSNQTPVTRDQLIIIQAYDRVLNSQSEEAMLKMVRQTRAGISRDHFLILVQMFGRRLNADYDKERQKAGWNGNGIVTGDQLLNAARYNTRIGFSDLSSPLASDPLFAGVCRDIADLQAKMLSAAGFKNTYIVGFAKTKGEYHETVITQDPDRPRTLYQMNYSALNTVSGLDGARALYQGPTDGSLNYRIAKPGGGTVADLPSEVGKFMAEIAGFDIRALDPLGRPTSSIFAPGARFGQDGRYRAGVFAGSDGVGNSFTGATLTKRWGDTLEINPVRFPGKIGVAAAFQSFSFGSGRPVREGEHLYLQLEQHAQIDLFKFSDTIKVISDTSLSAIGAVSKYRPVNDLNVGTSEFYKPVPQGSFLVDQKLTIKHGSHSTALQGSYTIGIQVAPGIADHRTYEKLTAYANHVYFRGEISHEVGNHSGRAIAALVLDHNPSLGDRGYLEGGYAGDNCGMSAHLAGRIGNDTSLILDRSIRRAGLTVACENLQTRFRLIGESAIEGPSNFFGGASLTWDF